MMYANKKKITRIKKGDYTMSNEQINVLAEIRKLFDSMSTEDREAVLAYAEQLLRRKDV